MLLLSRKSRGFTLIELTLVMVIAAILGAIATVAFRGEGINVSARAELLASDIRYVQFVAMTLNTSYRINFSANQYSFSSADGKLRKRSKTRRCSVITTFLATKAMKVSPIKAERPKDKYAAITIAGIQ